MVGAVASAAVVAEDSDCGATASERDEMLLATIDAGTFLDERADDGGARADLD
jgi:hypothetical protein